MGGGSIEQLQGGLNAWDCVCIMGTLALLPPYLIWKSITKSLTPYTRRKTWRRFLGDTAFRFVCSMKIKRLVPLVEATEWLYIAWAKWYNIPTEITELTSDANVLWIGRKRTDKVILYLHGGGYVLSMQYFTAIFWRYVQQELEKRGINVGVVVLNYSLIQTKPFPAQLLQTVAAVEYLISNGVQPENIQIVGDSAGGNLALALLSHMLHPFDHIPRINTRRPFKGMYMMSPWVRLTADTSSRTSICETDVISQPLLEELGDMVLSGLPASLTPYIQPSHAPDGWFRGADECAERFLITVGDKECLYHDVKEFAGRFIQENSGTRFLCQPDAVHNDPYFDFLVFETYLGVLTPVIIDWLAEGFI